ncbi:MAG TPA: hypothetical protein VF796_03380 [Humisphaera sp.]
MARPGDGPSLFANDRDFVMVCSYCRVACSGTTSFWHWQAGRQWSVTIDRPTLDDAFRRVVAAASDRGTFQALPALVRAWNELNLDLYGTSPGVPLDDLTAALELLGGVTAPEEARLAGYLAAVRSMAASCAAAGLAVMIGEG